MNNIQIFMIGGRARHGKDTLAGYMKKELEKYDRKVCIMHFSSYLNNMAMNYFGWDGKSESKPRKLLQVLGTDVIRDKLNKKFYLINRLKEDIEILSNYFDTFIISDVRLPIEYDSIKEEYTNTIKIHINRLNFESNLSSDEKSHYTETALDNYDDYNYKVENTTLEKLEIDAKKIVVEVIENA